MLFASQKSLRVHAHCAHGQEITVAHDTHGTVPGVPNRLHTDGAKELNLGKWGEKVRELEIKQTLSKPYSQFQNRAESGIRELKKNADALENGWECPNRFGIISQLMLPISILKRHILYGIYM
eukprot:scaffold199800_cov28-Attheya_sp.AAC.1